MVEVGKTPTAAHPFKVPMFHPFAPYTAFTCGAVILLKVLLKFWSFKVCFQPGSAPRHHSCK